MSTLEPRPGRESYGEGSAEVHALHANCALCGSWCIFARSLGELAAGEGCSGPDERDQVRGVHHAPAALGGLDQLERHGQRGGLGPVALGDLRPQPVAPSAR